jgi:hypothetical protein
MSNYSITLRRLTRLQSIGEISGVRMPLRIIEVKICGHRAVT